MFLTISLTLAVFQATLGTQQDAGQDLTWKRLAIQTIALLPDAEQGALQELGIEDLSIDYPKEADGKLVFLEKYDVGSIGFRTRDKSMSHLRVQLEPIPYSTDEYDVKMAGERALEMARALRPYYAEWKAFQPRGGSYIAIACRPVIGGIQSGETLDFYFRKSDGRLYNITGTVPLDYSQPFGKLITKQQAIANAWGAYYRWQPFPAGRLAGATLELGTYTHSYVEGGGSELTAEDFALAKEFVAVPLYVVTVSYGHSTRTVQVIVVDAVSGKVKTILDASAIGGGAPVADKFIGKESIKVTIGKSSAEAKLANDVKPLMSVPASWKVVQATVGPDNYAARLDPINGCLWLASDKEWYCYSLPEELKRAVEAATISGTRFGAPK